MELTGARFKPNHGALKLKDMNAVSAQEVSCCVYYTPKKYAAHVLQHFILLG